MHYLEFQKKFAPYLIFRSQDIEKLAPSFDKKALIRWQKKGYIQKIRNTYYYFNEGDRDEWFLYLGGNRIYTPSYISLESALSYYNLIHYKLNFIGL